MSKGPRNSITGADGVRMYQWLPATASPETFDWLFAHGLPIDPVEVLSVTSVKALCGEAIYLVQWKLNNIADAATGMRKEKRIGPRGGVKEVRVSDEYPGEFVRRMVASGGEQGKLDAARAWLKETADNPRAMAAVRGTLVHEAIELGISRDRISDEYVESAFTRLSTRDRNATHGGVGSQDVLFVQNCMANYWDMRASVPIVILAREVQVWNLTVGYAGTADVLLWVLADDWSQYTPDFVVAMQKLADKGLITQAAIDSAGGAVVLGDWKTSADVHTDNVVQVHAYLGTEFAATDGVIDLRLTEMIRKAKEAAIVHIRPDGWAIYFVDFTQPVMYAFLGSVAFARFLAMYKEPDRLFTRALKGHAE